jgi:hypothetical protein
LTGPVDVADADGVTDPDGGEVAADEPVEPEMDADVALGVFPLT